MQPAPRAASCLALGLALISAAGCKDEPSSLAQMAEQEQAETRASLQYATIPDPTPTPAGVDDALWADLSFYPAGITELGFMPRGVGVFAWIEGNIGAGMLHETCKTVLDSLDRYHMLRLDEDYSGSSTMVFYGEQVDRLAAERCARSVYSAMGRSASWAMERRGSMTVFGKGEDITALNWAQGGDQSVIVFDPDPSAIEGFFRAPETLQDAPLFVRALEGMKIEQGTARVIGLRDFGALLTGKASQGYDVALSFNLIAGQINVELELFYASAAEAAQASEGFDQFIVEVREQAELELFSNEGAREDGLRIAMHPKGELFADPEAKLRPLLELLKKRGEALGYEAMEIEALMGQARAAAGLESAPEAKAQAAP